MNSNFKVHQLIEVVKRTKADFVIMGGDLNFDPVDNVEETSLRELGKVMVNTAEQFSNSSHWWRASYGDPANSYSGEHKELTLDYIYIRSNRPDFNITTLDFDVSKILINYNIGQHGKMGRQKYQILGPLLMHGPKPRWDLLSI